MRATWVRAWLWIVMLAPLPALGGSAAGPPSAAAPDRPDAEMLLELDLLTDPRFGRRAAAPGGVSPQRRESSDDFDLAPDLDETRIQPRSPER